MPAYHIDLVTDRGLQRTPFTLDDERPLGPQLIHVLEELRQRGAIITGGPEDELVVRWNGGDVDTDRSPKAAGISPIHPIELRMMRREYVAARREPPATPFLPKGTYLAVVAGITGALMAWAGANLVTDLGDVVRDYDLLDLFVAAVLGGGVAAGVLWAHASVRGESGLGGIATGVILGACGGISGSLVALALVHASGLGDSRQSFVVSRLLTWSLLGALTGAFAGVRWLRREPRRILDGLLFGTASGVFAALVMSLPGPTDFWQLIAFALIGLGIGFGLTGPGTRRGIGVLTLETVSDRSVGLLGYREWAIPHETIITIGRSLGVDTAHGRCTAMLTADADEQAVTLEGKVLARPSPIVNEDVVGIGAASYRLRKFPEDAR